MLLKSSKLLIIIISISLYPALLSAQGTVEDYNRAEELQDKSRRCRLSGSNLMASGSVGTLFLVR